MRIKTLSALALLASVQAGCGNPAQDSGSPPVAYQRISAPQKEDDRYFYTRKGGQREQAAIYVREGANGRDHVLVDPAQWSDDGSVAFAEWSASPDGKRLAYAVQNGGSDWRTIKVVDVATGQPLADEVKWARFTQIAWAKDGSGFYYSRYPEPKRGSEEGSGLANHAVYFHRVGTPQAQDELFSATPEHPGRLNVAGMTADGRFAVIYSSADLVRAAGWLLQGGVVAIPSIRGGGEYGAGWHEAGRRERKRNDFDDFIAAAEYLHAHKIAPVGGITAYGDSAGGLLIGAVVNQRPELFGAALPSVGVMDMLRYDRFTGGQLWVGEYGDPSVEADFDNLLSYSPYHNVRTGKPYPAILATTGEADNRVVPAHSLKYVAALQAADLGSKPRLLRIDARAGHGAGKPTAQVIEEAVDMWAFAAHWTGLEVAP